MSDRSRLRLFVLRVLVVSVLGTLLGRLWFLQVHDGASYAKAAADNRVREIVEPATRGQVFDSAGRVLVSNRTAMVVSVNRAIVRKEHDGGVAVLARLSKVIGVPAAEITSAITPCGDRLPDGTAASLQTGCWNGSPYQPVPVQEYDTGDAGAMRPVLTLEEHRERFPGVSAALQAVRAYPQNRTAVHLLGHLGPISQQETQQPEYAAYPADAKVGRGGVEETYEQELHGVDGTQQLVVDKDGNVTGERGSTAPQPGSDLVLSLDSGVQKLAEKALADGIAKARRTTDRQRGYAYKAPTGAVVVLEAQTGRVAAMASYPSYDLGVFDDKKAYATLLKNPANPLLSNATQGTFAPGSTFKISSTVAAVASGSSLHGYYPCPPSYKVGNRVFRNYEGETFGTINFHKALVKSCDTVYYGLAYDEWVRDGGTQNTGQAKEVFQKTARTFGFGSPTGVDLPSESAGLITDREYKQADWQAHKADYCAGAARRAKGTYLQQLDAEACSDGYRYNAGDAVNFAIGQGDVLVTPLQLAVAYGALANGGTVYEPRVAKALLSADGTHVQTVPPAVKGHLTAAPATLAYIRDALAGVTQSGGTAGGAYAGFPQNRLTVAGKTGTAEVQGKQPTAWFASFAPVDKPRYVVVAMITQAGTGGTSAAPITRKIYDGLYGLEGKKALLRGGKLPSALPVVRPDGTIAPPGTAVPGAPPTVSSLAAGQAAPAQATPALFPSSGSGSPPALALGPPDADLPGRRTFGSSP